MKLKILYSEIVSEPQFFIDNKGVFLPEATTFMITGYKLPYLLTFLNSDIVAYMFKAFYAGGGLGEHGYRYKKRFLEAMPIPNLDNPINSDEDIFCSYSLSEEEKCYIAAQINPSISV